MFGLSDLQQQNLQGLTSFEFLYSRDNDEVISPKKEEGNAGYDLFVDPKWLREQHNGHIVIKPGETRMLSTGLRTVIPAEWYAQVFERGSTGTKAMKYGAGVIDSNFRGVWQVVITNCGIQSIHIVNDTAIVDSHSDDIIYNINKGVAQFVFLPVPKTTSVEISPEELLAFTSDRGEKMLGSTNK